MFRYFTYSKSTRWVHILQDLVKAYNSSVHRSIGMTPEDALKPINESLLRERQEKRVQMETSTPKLKVGDYVRLSSIKGTFEKGYLPNWTKEIFVIKGINRQKPVMFTVQDLKNQEIQGKFYTQELQRTILPKEINKVKRKK